MTDWTSLTVELAARSYDILIGQDLLTAAGPLIAQRLGVRRAILVTDESVAPLHAAPLEASLTQAGIVHQRIVVPRGEQTKSFVQIERLVDALLSSNVDRSTPIIALGGGVVGDLAGFAAAITLRGLDYVQIPTTLLSQVDSSVGGKTGINTLQGKNLVGSFHQPRLVLADTTTLSTLPRRELLAGYAEVVKYGLINDPGFFAWLEKNGSAVIEGDSQARQEAVLKSCQAKAAIVAEDERETGRRALLNLGHTFGHALEAEFEYGDELRHGEAVAIGMALAFDLSVRLGHCPAEDAARVRRHLAALGLPTGLETLRQRTVTAPALLAHMARDKKVVDGAITFVLARGIGHAFLTRDVALAEVEAMLSQGLAA